MPTHQYIGARYVPKFFVNSQTQDNDWAANTIYEPLTIVTYNGTSYTSKKRVPASVGNPSANAEYWAATGLNTAQYDALRIQVEDLQADVDDMKLDISEKNIIVISDSYGEGYTPEDGSVPGNGWPAKLRNILGVPAANYKNKYVGGAGFTTIAGNGGFIGALNAVATDDPDFVADIVIVAGGRNDQAATQSDIENDAVSFFTRAKALYPDCKVYCGMIAWDGAYAVQLNLSKVLRAYVNACTLCDMIYLGNSEYVLHQMDYLSPSDKKHPTSVGNTKIAHLIANILQGCGGDVHYSKSYTISPSTGINLSNTSIITRVDNDVTKFMIGRCGVTFTTPPSITLDGSNFEIASAGDLVLQTGSDVGIMLPVVLVFKDGTNKYFDATGTFKILDGKIYLAARKINAAGSNYETVTGVVQIQIERMEGVTASMP